MSGVGKMIKHVSLKVAVSALAIGATMVACTPAGIGHRPASAAAKPAKADQHSAAAFAAAQAAMQTGDLDQALVEIERAVELSPRDVGYRTFLADLYLKKGRFQSAEQTFGDVLRLDPDNVRAGLSLALARIALGRSAHAVAQLDYMDGRAPAGDLGLAYALAGDPARAVQLLEGAARAPGASARVRQNLALAYALAGDWQKARTTAAQDVSPADLGARMEQWAALARPKTASDQVAALLGVSPGEDPGQPVRLALAEPRPEPAAYAAAEPAPPAAAEPAPVETAAAAAPPAQLAAAAPPAMDFSAAPPPPVQHVVAEVAAEDSDWGRAPAEAPAAPVPAEETKPVYAEAIRALVTPQPSVMRASAPAAATPVRSFDRPVRRASARAVPAAPGRFAVQLGAFKSAAGVERAWASAYKRYGFAHRTPLSTTVRIAGKGVFHRLSVAGFDSHAGASQVCRSIRAKGGACFVRAVAGDAPTRWASRYSGRAA
jgi:Flp pilus assembly protein TadD